MRPNGYFCVTRQIVDGYSTENGVMGRHDYVYDDCDADDNDDYMPSIRQLRKVHVLIDRIICFIFRNAGVEERFEKKIRCNQKTWVTALYKIIL